MTDRRSRACVEAFKRNLMGQAGFLRYRVFRESLDEAVDLVLTVETPKVIAAVNRSGICYAPHVHHVRGKIASRRAGCFLPDRSLIYDGCAPCRTFARADHGI